MQMRRAISMIAISVWIASNAMAASSTVIGRSLSDNAGRGVINAPVNPELDGPSVADQVAEQVQLTNGARPRSVTVDRGNLSIEFEAAPPSQEVEAMLPAEVANRLGGGAILATDTMTPALIGGTAVLVTGGVLGGLAAAGKFDGEETFSPTR